MTSKKNKSNPIIDEQLSKIGELSSRISHDLKNPLSIIKVSIENITLGNSSLDKKTLECFTVVNRAISNMEHLIDGILDYAKPKTLILSLCSISDILDDTISKLYLPNTIKINKSFNDVKLICDEEQLQMVFTNILFNAIQAMNNNGTIDIDIIEEKNNILIKITDSGHGIAPEIITQIFNPLFTTKKHGTGLGLVSCKYVVSEHGGKIDVISVVNQGTTFSITLPTNMPCDTTRSNSTSDKILEHISQMTNYDHLAFEFSTEVDLNKQVSKFIIQGMKKNLLNIIIIPKDEFSNYVDMLTQNGIYAQNLLDSEDLIICTFDEIYQNTEIGSSFDPVIQSLNCMTDLAKRKKKSGLNIIGTLAGHLLNNENFKDCINIEKSWHEIIPKFDIPITLICPYKSCIPSKMIQPLISYHNKNLLSEYFSSD